MRSFPNAPYFPGLTGLRAFAAFTVLFTHVERYRQLSGKPLLLPYSFSSFLGGLAVSFFFVLSGFLITSLLWVEKERKGRISVKRFLRRRLYRIAPLYYTVLAAGYAVSVFILKDIPSDPIANGLLLNALLLPNLAFALNLVPDIIIQIWSIGTEMQFYLVWPFFASRPARNFAGILIALIVVFPAARLILHLVIPGEEWLNILLYRTRIDCMALGALAALLMLFKNENDRFEKAWRMLGHPHTGWISMIVFAVTLYVSWLYKIGFYPVYMLLSGILIIRVTQNPGTFLEWGPVRYLGKISYGIYLLHNFIIFFLYRSFPVLIARFDKTSLGEVTVFLLAAGLSVMAAAISYKMLEYRFLRMGNRYSSDSVLS